VAVGFARVLEEGFVELQLSDFESGLINQTSRHDHQMAERTRSPGLAKNMLANAESVEADPFSNIVSPYSKCLPPQSSHSRSSSLVAFTRGSNTPPYNYVSSTPRAICFLSPGSFLGLS
jgi:hypothetical protein